MRSAKEPAMKRIPRVQKHMTSMPHTIGRDILVKTAQSVMREYNIRHLPVQEGGRLVGILSDRDVKLAASLKGAEDLRVEDVMTESPFAVRPDAPLDEVAFEMAERKY